MKSKIPIIVVAVMAILMGLYPLIYLSLDENVGFLSSKSVEVLGSNIWMTCFYFHIIFGGISLLTGWSQFIPKWRNKYLKTHRKLGLVYLASVTLGGISGFYMALFANGGLVSSLGFGSLAFLWLFFTLKAYLGIINRDIDSHQQWMLRSYALTFAAVTLRLWLPALTAFGLEFLLAYKIISWLSWVPNLIFIEWVIRRLQVKPGYN